MTSRITPPWAISILIALMLHVGALVFIFRYTTTYPLAIDEWLHVVPRAAQTLEGNISLSDFIRANSRAGVPPIIHLHLWSLTLPNVLLLNWDLTVSSLLNYVVLIINSGLAIHILTEKSPKHRPLFLVLVTALFFGVQQRWNLITSIHLAIHCAILFLLLTLWFVSRPDRPYRHVSLACVMAYLGSLNSVVSWIVWITLFLALIGIGYRSWKHCMIWLTGVAFTALTLANVPGFGFSIGDAYVTESAAGLFSSFGTIILFFLVFVGGIFTAGPQSNVLFAFLMGSLGLSVYVLNVVYLWRNPSNRKLVVLCTMFAFHGLAWGGLAAVGRAQQFGVAWGAANHYMAYGALFWVGAGMLTITTLSQFRAPIIKQRGLLTVNALTVMFGIIFYCVAVLNMWQFAETFNNTVVVEREACIQEVGRGESNRSCEVVGGIVAAEDIQTLYKYRLTGFAHSLD